MTFVVFHSPRESRINQCQVLWAGVCPVTMWLRINITLNMVVWCFGFATSHLHFKFIFLPFLCFHLCNSFCLFYSYYTGTWGKVGNSQVVLKRISHYFKALTPPWLIPLYIFPWTLISCNFSEISWIVWCLSTECFCTIDPVLLQSRKKVKGEGMWGVFPRTFAWRGSCSGKLPSGFLLNITDIHLALSLHSKQKGRVATEYSSSWNGNRLNTSASLC